MGAGLWPSATWPVLLEHAGELTRATPRGRMSDNQSDPFPSPPRERTRFETGGIWRDDWQMDDSSSFSERLPACSALVTINSTCASEAALLGIPTATLGTGAFTGSGVTLECALDPSKLATLFSFQPDLHRCRAYCSAILGRHFLPYGIVRDRNCLEFEHWLAKSKTTELHSVTGEIPLLVGN